MKAYVDAACDVFFTTDGDSDLSKSKSEMYVEAPAAYVMPGLYILNI